MRIGINISDDLHGRLKRISRTVNVSQICREAIDTYVADHERARARVQADGLEGVGEGLCPDDGHLLVDWEELGWKDARQWVTAVEPDNFDHLFHRVDVLRRQGRPTWIVPPPIAPGATYFENRWCDYSRKFERQLDSVWDVDHHFDRRSDAERAYCRAWLAYVSAVREKVIGLRKERASRMIESRTARPEPEVPGQLDPASSDADRIRRYLRGLVDEARRAGRTTIALRAGDVHDALGLVNAHPNVCQVLEGRKFHKQAGVERVRQLAGPPSGRGANLVIEFRIVG